MLTVMTMSCQEGLLISSALFVKKSRGVCYRNSLQNVSFDTYIGLLFSYLETDMRNILFVDNIC